MLICGPSWYSSTINMRNTIMPFKLWCSILRRHGGSNISRRSSLRLSFVLCFLLTSLLMWVLSLSSSRCLFYLVEIGWRAFICENRRYTGGMRGYTDAADGCVDAWNAEVARMQRPAIEFEVWNVCMLNAKRQLVQVLWDHLYRLSFSSFQ